MAGSAFPATILPTEQTATTVEYSRAPVPSESKPLCPEEKKLLLPSHCNAELGGRREGRERSWGGGRAASFTAAG
jgi:hypothetical protein